MPAFRDFSQAYTTTTTGTTILVPIPAYEQNDLLVAVLTQDTGTPTWSSSGWTQLFSQTNTCNLAVLWKIAGASETDTTFTTTVGETLNGSIISIRDVNTSAPFNGSPGYVTSNFAAARGTMPTITTTVNNCLILYLASRSVVAVPSIIEGACSLIFGKDGSAHSDAASWGFQAAAGTTPANISISTVGTTNSPSKLATVAIAPPSGGATVIPGYCAADASIYVSPFTGAAYNTDLATTNTITTPFTGTINGKTLTTGGTTSSFADSGINSYHAMSYVAGVTTSGSWAGTQTTLAARTTLASKNILFHQQPYLPVDIQTTDSVSLTGTMGKAIGLASTAGNFKVWHVGGANTSWGTQRHAPAVVNTDATAGVIQTTGTFNANSITVVGNFISGKNVIPDWLLGSVWALDTTTICGGNATEPLDIEQSVIAYADGHERRSAIRQGTGQMMLLGPIQYGDGGTNPTFLDLNSTAIEFPRQYNKATREVFYNSVNNVAGITYYAGATDTIKHRNSVISSPSRYHWKLHTSSSTSASYDFSGLQVIGAGTISLARAITITGLTINDYSTLDVSGLTLTQSTILNMPATNDSLTTSSTTAFSYCTINTTTITSGNRWCSVASPTIFSNCTFTGSASTGHAIRITSTTGSPFSFVGNTFTNYGADGTNSAAIFNDSGGAIVINVSGGGTTPTIRNGSGASTTVNNNVSVSVTILDQAGNPIPGVEVSIFRDNTSRTVVLASTATNASGIVTTTAAQNLGAIIIRARQSTNKATFLTSSSGINTSTDTITTQANHNFRDGDAVVYSREGDTYDIGPEPGTYYVYSTGDTTLKLYDTAANAITHGATGLQDLSGNSGTEIHSLDPVRYIAGSATGTIGAGAFSTQITLITDTIATG